MQDLVEPINNGSCKYNPEMLSSDPEHGYKVNGTGTLLPVYWIQIQLGQRNRIGNPDLDPGSEITCKVQAPCSK
jgi:hypothetical protein